MTNKRHEKKNPYTVGSQGHYNNYNLKKILHNFGGGQTDTVLFNAYESSSSTSS